MITNHEWLLRNSLRAYPVQEDAAAQALNTGWRLDRALLTDLMICGDHSANAVCIQSVTITPAMCSVVVGDVGSGVSLAVATCLVDGPTDIPLSPLIEGVAGFISFGPAMQRAAYRALPGGHHQFGESAVVEARCVLLAGPMPVTALGGLAGTLVSGDVEIQFSDLLQVTVQTVEESGDIYHNVFLGLRRPFDFLSPCEEKSSLCDCGGTPVRTISDVGPDSDGILHLEFEDQDGQIHLLGPHTLSLLVERAANTFCSKAEEPDEYGRIKGAADSYEDDKPPITPYQNPKDESFPPPPLL